MPRRGRGGGHYFLYGTDAFKAVPALYAKVGRKYTDRLVERGAQRINVQCVAKRARP